MKFFVCFLVVLSFSFSHARGPKTEFQRYVNSLSEGELIRLHKLQLIAEKKVLSSARLFNLLVSAGTIGVGVSSFYLLDVSKDTSLKVSKFSISTHRLAFLGRWAVIAFGIFLGVSEFMEDRTAHGLGVSSVLLSDEQELRRSVREYVQTLTIEELRELVESLEMFEEDIPVNFPEPE